ncbi:uncharacterized protein LOC144450121 [Glandiceps talaboti]
MDTSTSDANNKRSEKPRNRHDNTEDSYIVIMPDNDECESNHDNNETCTGSDDVISNDNTTHRFTDVDALHQKHMKSVSPTESYVVVMPEDDDTQILKMRQEARTLNIHQSVRESQTRSSDEQASCQNVTPVSLQCCNNKQTIQSDQVMMEDDDDQEDVQNCGSDNESMQINSVQYDYDCARERMHTNELGHRAASTKNYMSNTECHPNQSSERTSTVVPNIPRNIARMSTNKACSVVDHGGDSETFCISNTDRCVDHGSGTSIVNVGARIDTRHVDATARNVNYDSETSHAANTEQYVMRAETNADRYTDRRDANTEHYVNMSNETPTINNTIYNVNHDNETTCSNTAENASYDFENSAVFNAVPEEFQGRAIKVEVDETDVHGIEHSPVPTSLQCCVSNYNTVQPQRTATITSNAQGYQETNAAPGNPGNAEGNRSGNFQGVVMHQLQQMSQNLGILQTQLVHTDKPARPRPINTNTPMQSIRRTREPIMELSKRVKYMMGNDRSLKFHVFGDANYNSQHNMSIRYRLLLQLQQRFGNMYTATQYKLAIRRRYEQMRRNHREDMCVELKKKTKGMRQSNSSRWRSMKRRESVLRGNEEKELWKWVTPELMSDEETLDDNTLLIKSPSWRASKLNEIIARADERLDMKGVFKRLQKKRIKSTVYSSRPRPARAYPENLVPPI